MTIEVVDRTFVDALLRDIVRPTADHLMESRFFTVHAVVDVDHSERAPEAVARLATTDQVRDEVRTFVGYKARLKLAKWDAIYDAYA
jgi:pyrroloquinoline quinone (PQQ) biosynthesis protein C